MCLSSLHSQWNFIFFFVFVFYIFCSKQMWINYLQKRRLRNIVEIERMNTKMFERESIPYLINSYIFFTAVAAAASRLVVCREWSVCVLSIISVMLFSNLDENNDEFLVPNLLVYSNTHLRSSVLLYLYLIHSKSARVVKIIFHSHSSSHSNNPHTLAYVCLLYFFHFSSWRLLEVKEFRIYFLRK
jgi:hypothetical protein